MKKVMLMTVLLMAILPLVACNAETETYEDEYYVMEAEEAAEEIEEAAEEWVTQSLTAQHLLEDLDIMMDALETSLPISIAYWARELDIDLMANNARADILNAGDSLDVYGFQNILHRNFASFYGFGAFNVWTEQQFSEVMRNPGPGRNIGSMDIIIGNSLDEALQLFLMLREQYGNDPQKLEYMFAQAIGMDIGWETIGSQISPILQVDDFETFYMLITSIADADYMDNVITDIIEEGHVAYLRINSFQVSDNQRRYDDGVILSFYEEIESFGHLIIDLRINNTTFNLDYVYNNLIGSLINENKTLYLYSFVTPDYIASRLVPSPPSIGTGTLADRQFIPIDEFLENNNLQYINMDDMERMAYGFRTRVMVRSRSVGNPAFEGNVWILTGSTTGTLSLAATWFAKEAEIATLVGGITNGNFGAMPNIVTMPNSGLVFAHGTMYTTDHHGRPLEAGTIPHYFNRPGMDALQTVLAMIEEGAY